MFRAGLIPTFLIFADNAGAVMRPVPKVSAAGSVTIKLSCGMTFSDDLPSAFAADEPDPELEAELDRDFPLGDGTADTNAMVVCPYCSATVDIALDPGSGGIQDYVEDCEVCCQPWRVSVTYGDEGQARVAITPLDQ